MTHGPFKSCRRSVRRFPGGRSMVVYHYDKGLRILVHPRSEHGRYACLYKGTWWFSPTREDLERVLFRSAK